MEIADMFTRHSRRLVAAALLLLALPVAAEDARVYGLPKSDPASIGLDAAKLDAMKSQLNAFIEKGQLPGIIVAVARDGKLGYFEAWGMRDAERKKPMTPDTIFRMYSMTKPVTGAAVMTLVDADKISLDDPLSKYLPEFKDMKVLVEKTDGTTELVPAKRPITLEHLMLHTSGLVYGLFDTGKLGEMYREADLNSDGSAGITLEEFAKRTAKLPLKSHPGDEWHYGINMDILGRVVEVVSGKRYADYLQEKIFGPLGMNDSGFFVPAAKADRLASNYGPSGGKMALIEDAASSPFLKVPSQDSGGGGMVATAGDYLRFAQMLLNGGELDGVRVLSEEAVAEMTSNHLPASMGDSPLNLFPGISFKGIGFGYCGAVPMDGAINTVFGDEGEYTWGGYASTDFWIDKKTNVVGMVLTQLIPTSTYPTRPIAHNGVEAALLESAASRETKAR
jgi:CubicO group peptidase (beta-lactamase class C family)